MASLFYDYKYFVPQNNIAVFRLRGLIAAIFQLKTDLNKIDFKILAGNYSIDSSDGYILFLHGTSKNNKKWPLASWQFLGEWILKETNKDIILTYSNSQEFDFANCLIKALANPRIKLLPKLEFLALADLIQQADLVVGVDTGFTHLANLLGIATLAIYLASDPAYVGIVENARAQNFGGNNKTVMPIEIIDFIKNKQLLSINSLNKITQNLQE